MKKVEVYFVINLGAILSLFAIEGELSVYMQRQDDILKNVAQDKLQTLVEISNVESNYEDSDYYRLFFNVEGQYEQGSIKFNPSFTTPIVEVGTGSWHRAVAARQPVRARACCPAARPIIRCRLGGRKCSLTRRPSAYPDGID